MKKKSYTEKELKDYFEFIRQKNQEAQSKLTITISWAGATFILGMLLDKIKDFSLCERNFIYFMFLAFSISLLIEFLAEIFLEKAAEYDKEANPQGDIYDFLGRKLVMFRNLLFTLGLISLIIVVYQILIF